MEGKPEHHEHHEHSAHNEHAEYAESHHAAHQSHNAPKAAVHKHHVPTHRKDIHFGKPRKTPWKRYIIGALGFLILLAIVVAIILFVSRMGGKRVAGADDVAATVNGEKITVGYLDDQYARVPATYKPFITKSMLLNQTINEFLLMQEAKKQGIEVTKEDVQAEIETAMTRAGVTSEQLDARLAEQNITRAFLEDLYMKQLTITKLLEKTVFGKIKVTDSDVEEFYNSRIHASHILVDTEEAANSIIASLKKFSQAKIEAEFSKLAKSKSKDPSAKENGGDLGEFGKGQMVPAFEQVAFGLEEYAFTAEPVKTQFGYHVILRLPKNATLEEQGASIKEFLLSQKKAAAVPLYVDQLRNKAVIDVLFKEEPVAVEPELDVQSIVQAEPAAE